MIPRERFLAALAGRPTDRPALAHVAALTTVELQRSTGCSLPEVHRNPETLVRLCAANHEILGFDAVTFIVNYFGEPAALGCGMDWGDERRLPACASRPWRTPADAVVPADVLDREPLRTNRRAVELAARRYGGRIAVLGKIMGPLSMVQSLAGVERTMVAMIEEPGTVSAFLETATDLLIRSGRALLDAGADALAIGEGGAGGNMLSPAMHERFLLPVHRRLTAGVGGPTIMHICGDITPRLEMLARTGFACFNFDWSIAPEAMLKAAGGRFTLMGNVSTTALRTGTPAEVAAQVRACAEAGIPIISPGCAISPECPNANLAAMAQTLSVMAK